MVSLRRVVTSRYAIAALGGACLACAFPNISVSGLAWIAPGILAGSALGRGGWERFRIGFTGGFVFYLISLYWLLEIPFRWMGIPFGPAAGWLALSAYLALYPALWVWLVTSAGSRGPGASWTNALESLQQKGWLGRTGLALYAAVLWVALEMVIARLFSGFPWDLLGVSQYGMIPLIQVASITGVYGVSFLIIWISMALLMAAVVMLRRPAARSAWAAEVLVPFLTVAFLFSWGMRQVAGARDATRTVKAALVQPSIPQTLIWNPEKNEERFREVLSLSEAALTNNPDVLIWPESAVPALFRENASTRQAILDLARRHRVWMIIGADDFSIPPGAKTEKDVHYFNSSFLISPEGEIAETYRKRSLVIFGEYVPLQRWLPFLKYLTPIGGGFKPGDKSVQFDMRGTGAMTSVLICFEDIFPHLSREGGQPDTDFLVNLTNNGWFGESAAQWQHAVTSIFRAVENRIPLVRCSNNGITCWVDSYGRIRQVFRDARGSVYGPGFLVCDIPLLAPGELREPTVYHRHGDRFGWVCVMLAALWLPFGVARKRSTEGS